MRTNIPITFPIGSEVLAIYTNQFNPNRGFIHALEKKKKRRKKTLATITRFAHVREYNTEVVVGLGHMFHALSLLLRL